MSGKFLHILFDCRRKMRMVFDYHISFNGFLRIKADLCLVEKKMVNVLLIPTEINRTTKLTQQYFWLSSKIIVNLNLSHFYSSGCITWRGRSWVVWWTIQRRIPSKKSRLLWWRWRRKLLKLTYWEITAIDPDSKGLLMSKQCIRISFSR